ncbi:MAG: hypothetical protein ACHQQQ_00025 [Bacteroidota bacterium]
MNEIDKTEIKQIISEVVEPLVGKIDRVSEENKRIIQFLFGIGGNDGIDVEFNKMKNNFDQFKTFRTQVITIFATLQIVTIIIFQIILLWVKGKFMN